jgi:hypothetical protein
MKVGASQAKPSQAKPSQAKPSQAKLKPGICSFSQLLLLLPLSGCEPHSSTSLKSDAQVPNFAPDSASANHARYANDAGLGAVVDAGTDHAGDVGAADTSVIEIYSENYSDAVSRALQRLDTLDRDLANPLSGTDGVGATQSERELDASEELQSEIEAIADGVGLTGGENETVARISRSHLGQWPSDRGPIPPEPVGSDASACPAGLTKIVGSSWSDDFGSWWPYTCVVGLGGNDYLGLADSAHHSYLLGNNDHDQLSLWYYAQSTVIAGGQGYDYINGSDLDDVVYGGASPDDIYGWWGSDYLSGGAGDDYIIGGRDHDEIYGDLGNDTLVGGSENDKVVGGPGADLIVGDCSTCLSGDDYLVGGLGNDELWGGSGADVVIAGPGRDFVDAGSGNDTVYIYDECELSSGESLSGSSGWDRLITPLSVAQLNARGVSVSGFEEVVLNSVSSHLSECGCFGHGEAVIGPESVTCTCDPGWTGAFCEVCDDPDLCVDRDEMMQMADAVIALVPGNGDEAGMAARDAGAFGVAVGAADAVMVATVTSIVEQAAIYPYPDLANPPKRWRVNLIVQEDLRGAAGLTETWFEYWGTNNEEDKPSHALRTKVGQKEVFALRMSAQGYEMTGSWPISATDSVRLGTFTLSLAQVRTILTQP